VRREGGGGKKKKAQEESEKANEDRIVEWTIDIVGWRCTSTTSMRLTG